MSEPYSLLVLITRLPPRCPSPIRSHRDIANDISVLGSFSLVLDRNDKLYRASRTYVGFLTIRGPYWLLFVVLFLQSKDSREEHALAAVGEVEGIDTTGLEVGASKARAIVGEDVADAIPNQTRDSDQTANESTEEGTHVLQREKVVEVAAQLTGTTEL